MPSAPLDGGSEARHVQELFLVPKQKSEQYAEPVKSLDGVYSIGAVRLWRDYEEDEVAADTRYKGQRLRVTGPYALLDKTWHLSE